MWTTFCEEHSPFVWATFAWVFVLAIPVYGLLVTAGLPIDPAVDNGRIFVATQTVVRDPLDEPINKRCEKIFTSKDF